MNNTKGCDLYVIKHIIAGIILISEDTLVLINNEFSMFRSAVLFYENYIIHKAPAFVKNQNRVLLRKRPQLATDRA
jgi:hypothetical protein